MSNAAPKSSRRSRYVAYRPPPDDAGDDDVDIVGGGDDAAGRGVGGVGSGADDGLLRDLFDGGGSVLTELEGTRLPFDRGKRTRESSGTAGNALRRVRIEDFREQDSDPDDDDIDDGDDGDGDGGEEESQRSGGNGGASVPPSPSVAAAGDGSISPFPARRRGTTDPLALILADYDFDDDHDDNEAADNDGASPAVASSDAASDPLAGGESPGTRPPSPVSSPPTSPLTRAAIATTTTRRTVPSLESENSFLRSELLRLGDELSSLRRSRAESADEARGVAEAAERERDAIKFDLDASAQELSMMKSERDDKERALSSTRRALEECRGKRDALFFDNEGLREESKLAAEEATAQRAQVEKERDEARSEVEVLRGTIEEGGAERRRIEREAEEAAGMAREEAERMGIERDRLRAEARKLEREVNRLGEELGNCQTVSETSKVAEARALERCSSMEEEVQKVSARANEQSLSMSREKEELEADAAALRQDMLLRDEKLERQRKECDLLRIDAKEAAAGRESLEEALERCKNEIAENKASRDAEEKALQAKLEQLEKDLSDREGHLASSREECEILTKREEEMRTKSKATDVEVERLREERDELVADAASLERKLKQLEEKYGNVQSEYNAIRIANVALMRRCNSQQEELQQSNAEATEECSRVKMENKRLEAEVAALRQDILLRDVELENQRKEYEVSRDDAEEAAARHETLERAFNRCETAHEAEKKALLGKLKQLEKNLSDREDDLASSREECYILMKREEEVRAKAKATNAEVEGLREERSQFAADATSRERDLNVLEEKHSTCQSECDALTERCNSLEEELLKANAKATGESFMMHSEKEGLEGDIAALRRDILLRREELENQRKEYELLRSDANEAAARHETLEQLFNRHKEETTEMKTAHDTEKKALRAKVNQLERDLSDREDNLASRSGECDILTKGMEEVRAKSKAADAEVESLRKEREQLAADAVTSERDLKLLEEKQSGFETEVDALKIASATLMERCNFLQEELQQSKAEATVQCSRMEKEKEGLEADVAALRQYILLRDEELERQRDECEVLRSDADEAASRYETLEQALNRCKDEIAEMKISCDSEKEALRARVAQLEQDLSDRENDLGLHIEECSALRKKKVEADARCVSLEGVIKKEQALEKEALETRADKNAKLEMAFASVQKALNDMEENLRKCKQRCQDLEEVESNTRTLCLSLEKERDCLRDESASLKEVLGCSESAFAKLQRNLETSKKNEAKLIEKCSRMENEIPDLKAAIRVAHQAKDKLKSHGVDLDGAKEKLSSLAEEVLTLRRENEELRCMQQIFVDKLSEKESSLADFDAKLERLRAEKQKNDFVKLEVDSFKTGRNEVSQLRQKMHGQSDRIKELEHNLVKLEASNTEFKEGESEAETKWRNLQNEQDSIQANLVPENQRNGKLYSASSLEQERCILQLGDALSAKKREANEFQIEIDCLNESIVTKEKETKAIVSELLSEINSADSEKSELTRKVDALTLTLTAEKRQSKLLQMEIAGLEASLSLSHGETLSGLDENTKVVVRELIAELDKVDSERSKYVNQCKEIEGDLRRERLRCQEKQLEVDSLLAEHDLALSDRDESLQRIETARVAAELNAEKLRSKCNLLQKKIDIATAVSPKNDTGNHKKLYEALLSAHKVLLTENEIARNEISNLHSKLDAKEASASQSFSTPVKKPIEGMAKSDNISISSPKSHDGTKEQQVVTAVSPGAHTNTTQGFSLYDVPLKKSIVDIHKMVQDADKELGNVVREFDSIFDADAGNSFDSDSSSVAKRLDLELDSPVEDFDDISSIQSLQLRCDILESERREMLNLTLELVESSRQENQAYIEAVIAGVRKDSEIALAHCRKKSRESLKVLSKLLSDRYNKMNAFRCWQIFALQKHLANKV
uniref:Uncharacterized protein n=1 Tax=Odontella aurita TaxID=265563 RepID=A0A7S4J6F1_9STRA